MFSIIIITPVVIMMIDDGQDIAFYLDMNEEEENSGKEGKEGKEAAKDLEVKVYPTESSVISLLKGIHKKRNVRFQSKNYISEYPKNTTPPPELMA
jgi:hypothetical protein